ncbi:protein kinase domain-containing protein [Nannocystaceae bacterium ST9]
MATSSSLHLDPVTGDPLIGQTLGGKYTLERLIGRGGMGHVYLANEAGNDTRQVVVKMLAPTLAQQPQAMARFDREAKRLDGLRHSNIVEMYDHGHASGRAYIVMEYVDGELLSDFMAAKGALTLTEFVPIAAQILKGVGHAHSRDLMIRDIKPSNVMLCERKGRANFVKIIDFGLAKMLEGDEDITKQHFVGTAGYLSPEQIKGLDLDLRVDVYALGVLFYQMLSGRMPFEAENDTTMLYKHVHDFPAPLSEVLPADHGVPEELIHLIHDCLEKDPKQRPRDANEIVEKLIDCVPMAMFKLPAAALRSASSSSAGVAVSALSTAALTAPTGETATYLERELTLGDSEVSSARPQVPSSGERQLTPVSASHPLSVEQPLPPAKRSPLPMILGGLVVVALGVGAVLLLGNKDAPSEAGKPDASAEIEPSLAEAEKQAEAGEFDAAAKTLAGLRGQLEDQPALSGRVERLDKQIEVGRLLVAARKLDEAGKTDAAIMAFEDVLEADAGNTEARERLADLRVAAPGEPDAAAGVAMSIKSEPVANLFIDGTPTGTTPFSESLTVGKHEIEISADGYETWRETIEVKAADNLPISVKLSKKDRKSYVGGGNKPPPGETNSTPPPTEPDKKPNDNPFLPTSKDKQNNGPFLPTEKKTP